MTKTNLANATLFDLNTGLSNEEESVKRHLSDMKKLFHDTEALEQQLDNGDNPLIYEYYALDLPNTAGDIQYGTSIVYPGTLNGEYYMTKGHFHEILETGEVYFCLSGQGYMLMESPEGEWEIEELVPGRAVQVPPRYAHRSINTGNEPMVTFFTFRADAGHDYGSIETKGYRKLVVEKDGKPEIIDNPKWAL
ncbi:glucose-6-phosphate isomerase family protein [Edaphobacillus lindanitolerans]|uniref:glucose-6-phosphate isomerase n=1 Tax=Edaphobacillus lindanitolerans TaxID=550447 RepID=A0A1U7PMZ2_9BACI|nr:glucose-6-phosphate isomerase family protein [Edaphobacillus lindanitolerans]SIT73092.1 glucose-6-phosphate isomerase [Edaphobacillus lindanitolerans]